MFEHETWWDLSKEQQNLGSYKVFDYFSFITPTGFETT